MTDHTPAAPSNPPSLFRNPISLFGAGVTLLVTAIGLPMMFLDLLSPHSLPYLGVVIYLVLPGSAVCGVIVALLGVAWERRRRRRRPELGQHHWPVFDMNRPKHQALMVSVIFVTIVIVVLLSVTGYRAYHFTESVEFCGLVCHQVMRPEYTAYQHSPHARVKCAECHIGSGADWFVRSKISGLYQVYATVMQKYPRPIPTPVHNLRPAQETCEQCHWPSKFFGAQQKVFSHYLTDEDNSPWQIQMLLKVGGGDPETTSTSGIHWHMNIENEIYYIADEKREQIPWVRLVDPHGKVTEFMSTEQPITPEQMANAEIRRMDCIDCHNRPAHIYLPPDRAVELAMEAGRMDSQLPYLKRESMRLLLGSYASQDEASDAILTGLAEFYQSEHPDIYREHGLAIQHATTELQRIYARNFFPEMKTDWRAYPDHISHLNSTGCFRCHDGLHRSVDGQIISKDCNACHVILAQGPPSEIQELSLQAQPFRHPVDLGMDVTEFACSDCHDGTGGL